MLQSALPQEWMEVDALLINSEYIEEGLQYVMSISSCFNLWFHNQNQSERCSKTEGAVHNSPVCSMPVKICDASTAV